jgi:1,4-dihydroxy-2-naphthoate octaprenyltransferase
MAPHTWVASVAPVVVGGALVIGLGDYSPLSLLADTRALAVWLLMLLCSVCAQSAVNALNDYQDFRKGTDTEENCVDTSDAAIIYHNLDPKAARSLACACVAVAGVCGIVITLLSSPVIFALGLTGVAILFFYSSGPKPISYLPLGEVVSGLAMGGIITIATYWAMTGRLASASLLGALPPFVTIALIMQANNTSDIERDIIAGRRTLPIYLGERRSARIIAGAHIATLVFMGVYVLANWPNAAFAVVLFAGLISYPNLRTLAVGPYNAFSRPVVMKAVVAQAVVVNAFFTVAILLGAHLAQ